jgi:hypothetical protein
MTGQEAPAGEKYEIPVFPGWINLTDAADLLGISRTYAHELANSGGFKTAHRLAGSRRIIIVREAEVKSMKRERAARAGRADAGEEK